MYRKISVAGSITEVWYYEQLNTTGGGSDEENHECTPEQKEENYRNTQRKRRTTIRQLICANFDVVHSKFVTLTFDNQRDYDITDVKACNIAFDRFLKRLKYKYKDMKYVAVVEFQDKNDRGAVHYHMVCTLPYIKKSILAQIWGQGFVKINDIDKVDNLGAYVTKYMNKDIDDKRLQGLKAYNCSKGLEKPLQIKSWSKSDHELNKAFDQKLKGKSPVYCSEYTSDKCGKIIYQQYNDNRKK